MQGILCDTQVSRELISRQEIRFVTQSAVAPFSPQTFFNASGWCRHRYNRWSEHDSPGPSKPTLPCSRPIARLGGGAPFDSRGRAGFKSHAFSFHSAIQGGVWRNSASVSLTGTNRESETSLDSYRFLDHRYLYGSGLFQSRQLQHSFPSPCRHVSIGIPAAVPADFLSGTAVANQPGTRLSFAYGQNFGD